MSVVFKFLVSIVAFLFIYLIFFAYDIWGGYLTLCTFSFSVLIADFFYMGVLSLSKPVPKVKVSPWKKFYNENLENTNTRTLYEFLSTYPVSFNLIILWYHIAHGQSFITDNFQKTNTRQTSLKRSIPNFITVLISK